MHVEPEEPCRDSRPELSPLFEPKLLLFAGEIETIHAPLFPLFMPAFPSPYTAGSVPVSVSATASVVSVSHYQRIFFPFDATGA